MQTTNSPKDTPAADLPFCSCCEMKKALANINHRLDQLQDFSEGNFILIVDQLKTNRTKGAAK